MASNQTTNLKLHKWAAGDRVRREEFNQNSDKIDSAFKTLESTIATSLATAGNCKVASGSYTGKGSFGSSNPTNLTFPFEPKLVVIVRDNYTVSSGESGYFPDGFAVFVKGASSISIVGDGGHNTCNFSMTGNVVSLRSGAGPASQFNSNGITYHYIAIG